MLRYLGTGERRYGSRPVRPHARAHWEFQAVLSGVIAPSPRGQPASSMLWVFPPHHVHGWTAAPDGVAEVAVFHFAAVDRVVQQAVAEGPLCRELSPTEVVTVRGYAAAALEALRQPDPRNRLRDQRLLAELSLLALADCDAGRLGPPSAATSTAHLVDDANTWFLAHLQESPGVAEVARAVGVSTSHLRRLFHAVHGCSSETVLNDLRFARARELLAEGDLTLEAIAARCGMAGASAFSHAFKRHSGMSPAAWRSQGARSGT